MSSVKEYLHQQNIKVYGFDDFEPIVSLENSGLDNRILEILKSKSITEPTPIQSVCWPIALKGKNIVGIAQTGSGKTLGFLIPAMTYILKQPPSFMGDGPICLVLCPTRELAQQVQANATTFGAPLSIHNDCIYGGGAAGGGPKKSAIMDFFNPHIVIATPGRLIALLEGCETSLNLCSYLILDEADRMLDLGFKPQIAKILEYLRPDRQTLMFSATWPREVHDLAADILKDDYVKIVVGAKELTANKNIQQIINFCEHHQKQNLMLNLITEICKVHSSFRMLIFVRTKKKCNIMNSLLIKRGCLVGAIHGDKQQLDREQVLLDFKNGVTPILVATSVASRGLDVEDIHFVINFDFPDTMEDYVHRIGRTARCNTKEGIAYTFFTPKNYHMSDGLLELLEDCGQEIPDILPELASKYGRCKEERRRKERFRSRSRSRSREGRRRTSDDRRRRRPRREESEDDSSSSVETHRPVTNTIATKKDAPVANNIAVSSQPPKSDNVSAPTVTTSVNPFFTLSTATTDVSVNAYDTYLALQATKLLQKQNPELYKEAMSSHQTGNETSKKTENKNEKDDRDTKRASRDRDRKGSHTSSRHRSSRDSPHSRSSRKRSRSRDRSNRPSDSRGTSDRHRRRSRSRDGDRHGTTFSRRRQDSHKSSYPSRRDYDGDRNKYGRSRRDNESNQSRGAMINYSGAQNQSFGMNPSYGLNNNPMINGGNFMPASGNFSLPLNDGNFSHGMQATTNDWGNFGMLQNLNDSNMALANSMIANLFPQAASDNFSTAGLNFPNNNLTAPNFQNNPCTNSNFQNYNSTNFPTFNSNNFLGGHTSNSRGGASQVTSSTSSYYNNDTYQNYNKY